jgi:hypothetical protein
MQYGARSQNISMMYQVAGMSTVSKSLPVEVLENGSLNLPCYRNSNYADALLSLKRMGMAAAAAAASDANNKPANLVEVDDALLCCNADGIQPVVGSSVQRCDRVCLPLCQRLDCCQLAVGGIHGING